jgi:hypothetical protein
MASDKPLIRNVFDQRPLGRPDIRDDAVIGSSRKRGSDEIGQGIDGPAGKDRLRTLDGLRN